MTLELNQEHRSDLDIWILFWTCGDQCAKKKLCVGDCARMFFVRGGHFLSGAFCPLRTHESLVDKKLPQRILPVVCCRC